MEKEIDKVKISKKEKDRVLKILNSNKPEFIECQDKSEYMPNKKLPKWMNWDDYPLYRVVFHKNGATSLKLVREGKY